MNTLMCDFADYLRDDRKVSSNTLASYTRDVRRFCDYAAAHSLDVLRITKTNVITYMLSMQKSGSAASTV